MATSALFASVLLFLEANRNLIRLAREKRINGIQLEAGLERLAVDAEMFTLRELTLDLCLERTMPVLSTPRSLDLVHLRSAMWFHLQQPLTRFVSLDLEQCTTAKELGLPTR